MAMEEKKTVDLLLQNFPGGILEVSTSLGDDIVMISREALLPVASFLKSPPHDFTLLLDLTCVDYQHENLRFEMVYHLFSAAQNKRLRIKTRLAENDLRIASLASVWKNANWLEREVYDLFGVRFEGHPDLRRIFMWEGFDGHPLRKDYPLRRRQPIIRLRE